MGAQERPNQRARGGAAGARRVPPPSPVRKLAAEAPPAVAVSGRSPTLLYVATGVGATVGVSMVLVVAYTMGWMGGDSGDVMAAKNEPPSSMNSHSPEPLRDGDTHAPQPDQSRTNGQGDREPVGPSPQPVPDPSSPNREREAQTANPPPDFSSKPRELRDPFEDIRRRDNHLQLPPIHQLSASSAEPLATVAVDDAKHCNLTILGSEEVLGDGAQFQLNVEDTEEGHRNWAVAFRPAGGGEGKPVGDFLLAEETFSFSWKTSVNSTNPEAALRFCLLKIEVDDNSEVCLLNQPERVGIEPLRIRRSGLIEFPLNGRLPPNREAIRLQMRPEGFRDHDITPGGATLLTETTTIRCADRVAGNVGPPLLEVECALDADGLEYEWYYFPTRVARSGEAKVQKRAASIRDVKDQPRHLKSQGQKVQRDIEKLLPLIQQVEARLQLLKNKAASTPRAEQNAWTEALNRFQAQHDALKQQLAQLTSTKERLEKGEEYCERVESLLSGLEGRCRLHVRLFIEVEGEEITLIETVD